MKKIQFILIFLIFGNSFAANNPAINVFEMKHQLDKQTKHIQELSREMSHVENNLVNSNKKYSKLANDRIKLEDELSITKKNAEVEDLNLKKNYKEAKNILMGVLINKMEQEDTPSNLLTKKILMGNLQRRLIDLDTLINANKIILDEVELISERLKDSFATEKELVAVMRDLDIRKKELRETLELESQNKEVANQQFLESKNKISMEQAERKKEIRRQKVAPIQITEEIKIPSIAQIQDGDFYAPLAIHQEVEHQSKGVTFTFLGKNEVRATKSGKIVYVGALANYGNVVMIDHGKDLRSVILGQFDYVVKNGDLVRDSELLGYTKSRAANGMGGGKIYFEVRKHNLAQNTYLLLDKKSLAKNSSK